MTIKSFGVGVASIEASPQELPHLYGLVGCMDSLQGLVNFDVQ
jgi:hypothetical protein